MEVSNAGRLSLKAPLEGIKILDLTSYQGGPYCTWILASLGAEVVKLERPKGGDFIRLMPSRFPDANVLFILLNLHKKSITLNLNSEQGQQILKQLVTSFDVLVENFTPGVIDKWGLGFEVIKKVNPKIIYASLLAFGESGPYSRKPGIDTVIQAMSGIAASTGFPDGPPTKVGAAIADNGSGLHLAIGILAALYNRDKINTAQRIEISMQEATISLACDRFYTFYDSGRAARRVGNRLPGSAPYNIYQTKDGYVLVGALTPNQWDALLKAINREDLLGNEAYATQHKRWSIRDEVDNMIEGWAKDYTSDEVFEKLSKSDVPCGKVLDEEKLLEDPHLAYREFFIYGEYPKLDKKLKFPGLPIRMSSLPRKKTGRAPLLGEHNEEIYSQFLGYTKEEIVKLKNDGVI